MTRIVRFFQALGANLFLLLGLLLIYSLVVVTSIAADSHKHKHVVVDVVFVFDTTSSMLDEIDALLKISSQFAYQLASSGAQCQFGMVSFAALEDPKVICDTFPLSNNLQDFQDFLRNTKAPGGGKEDQPTAMKYAMDEFKYRPTARKVLILITDEPILGSESGPQGDPKAVKDWDSRILKQLVDDKFLGYAVALPQEPFKEVASRTGGKFFDIQSNRDFTSILLDIADAINASLTR